MRSKCCLQVVLPIKRMARSVESGITAEGFMRMESEKVDRIKEKERGKRAGLPSGIEGGIEE